MALDEKPAESWQLLGEILAIEGQEEQSQQAFRKHMAAINQHPAIKEAIRLIDEGKLGLAEDYCRDYLIRFPTDVTVIRLLAEVGPKLGILQEAKLLLERCL